MAWVNVRIIRSFRGKGLRPPEWSTQWGSAYAIRRDRYKVPLDRRLDVGPESLYNCQSFDFGRHVDSLQHDSDRGQAHPKDKLSEVLIAGDHHSALGDRAIQDCFVGRTWREGSGAQDVILLCLQESHDNPTDVRVDEEFHADATSSSLRTNAAA